MRLALLLLLIGTPLHAQIGSDSIDALVTAHRDDAFRTYRALLRLPNDAHHHGDMRRMIAFVDSSFTALGFTTRELPTEGLPLLLAQKRWHGPEAPTVLVYLQADGQPVDASAWGQPDPFDPVLKERTANGEWQAMPWERLYDGAPDPEWRVFARSASDSKGPVAQFLATMAILEHAGITPAFNVKVIVDTEEELGSPHLPAAVERFRDVLSAMLVIFDGPPHASGAPTLTFGARGIATATLTTYGPSAPPHSGHYGNWAPNPVFRLAALLASMKDDAGRVTIPGWYDGISLDDATRAILEAVPDDEAAIRRRMGLAVNDSVAGSLQEALQYPSLNVRGLRAAWVGDEARTIIPATAVAELDIRLVKESDPDRLLRLLRAHVAERGFFVIGDRDPTEDERLQHPRIARLDSNVSYAAYRTAFDSPPGEWLTRALTRLHGAAPIRIRTSGGSIPISPFVETLGVPAVTVPTVNPDNNQHSPNENLRVGSFVDGLRTMIAVFAEPLDATR